MGPDAKRVRLLKETGSIVRVRLVALPMSSFVRPDPAATHAPRAPALTPKRSWRDWIVGRRLPTADHEHQSIGKAVGLAVFASDALSSTAYATQEILVVLAAAGAVAFG